MRAQYVHMFIQVINFTYTGFIYVLSFPECVKMTRTTLQWLDKTLFQLRVHSDNF